MEDDARRVSDRDREEAVVALRDDLVSGALTLEEFSARVEAAYLAQTTGELDRVRTDLQTRPVKRRPTRMSVALFGHLIRRGRLRLHRRTTVVSAFADVDLDLREAQIEGLGLTVTVCALFGNVDVYVPEGVDVAVDGIILFGRRRDWGRDAARAGGPAVLVRALGCFGTVDVWRVPPNVQGTYGEILDELTTRQQSLPG